MSEPRERDNIRDVNNNQKDALEFKLSGVVTRLANNTLNSIFSNCSEKTTPKRISKGDYPYSSEDLRKVIRL